MLLMDRSTLMLKIKEHNAKVPLLYVARHGDIEMVEMLLDRDASTDGIDECGETALHCAIYREDAAIIDLLLNRGMYVDAVDRYGVTPFLAACRKNCPLSIIKIFLKHKACINPPTYRLGVPQSDYTPLHYAVTNNNRELTKLLLDNQADVNITISIGTPLDVAARRGHLQLVEDLLNYGAHINSALHVAARYGHEEVVKLLLSKGANINACTSDNAVPLYIATKEGYETIVKIFLQHGANVNARKMNYKSILYVAVKKAHESIVQLLLQHGVDVNAQGIKHKSILRFAIEKGHEGIVQLLLQHGADVNAQDTKDKSILRLAIEEEHEGIVRLLLQHGVDINDLDAKDTSLLHLAIEKEHEGIVQLLLQHGANVNAQDSKEKSILHFAVEKGNSSIIECILKSCHLDVNNEKNRISLLTAISGDKERYKRIVEDLLKYGFTVNAEDINNRTLLRAAVKNGYLEVFKELLRYGADVNMLSVRYDRFLHVATKHNHEEMVRLLLSSGADLNAEDGYGNIPLFYAVKNLDIEMIKLLLLANTANIKCGSELLYIAVTHGDLRIVTILLQNISNIDVNATNAYGSTALGYIVRSQSFVNDDAKHAMLKLLVSRGADVNIKLKNGESILHWATRIRSLNIVISLLEYNADVNCSAAYDITPLHVAAEAGNQDIFKLLLNKGANVNAKQTDGITPLHIAAKKGNQDIFKLLLNKGANVNAKQTNGFTPLHIAAEEGNQDISKLLLNKGANVNANQTYEFTPLHMAAQHGSAALCKTLILYGADVNAKSNKGTALHLAAENLHKDVVEILLECGSDVNIMVIAKHSPFFICSCGNIRDESNSGCYVNIQRAILWALLRHIAKMRPGNTFVSNHLLPKICSELGDAFSRCEREVTRIRNKKIGNTNISFYDVLTTKEANRLAVYARNKTILKEFKSSNIRRMFPIYACDIRSQFRKGRIRTELLKSSVKSAYSLFGYQLPDICIRQIVSYLNNMNLRNLITACPVTDDV